VRAREKTASATGSPQGIKVGEKVVVVGVGFFDFTHGQTGHVNNYLELHPLLSLRPFRT
jgi:hypothetical protein